MAELTAIDAERARALHEAEDARFASERPASMALLERGRASMPRGVPMSWMDDLYEHSPLWVSHGSGAYLTDVDGHSYLDMYIADMSGFCGHAPAPVVEAVARRMERGNQFLLPSEDAIAVAEHLVDRYGLPQWQFTLSGTQANTEVIRLAREMTGREAILVFDGKYHGEGDTTLVVLEDGKVVPEMRGLPGWIGPGSGRPVQRSRGAGNGTPARGRRPCPRGASDDERRLHLARGWLSRGAPASDAKGRNVAGHR